MSSSLLRSSAVLALALGGLACGDSDSSTGPSSTQTAEVRVAHLSPDAPNVDVRVNGTLLLQNVPFGAVSSYSRLPAGSARIQVSPAGATTPVVIDADVTLNTNTAYTVAATGRLADIEPLVLQDDRNPTGGQAKVRFVHASPDAPAVDVAVTGGPVVFSSVTFRESEGYGTVSPATYDLEVRAAGTSTVALRVPGVPLNGTTNYTIFAIGLLGDGSLRALPAVDAP